MSKTKMLRKLLQENKLLVTAGAHDALSAKIIEQAGFETVFISGFGLEASLLGAPDSGMLTMSEVVGQARNIAGAVNVPCLADAEAGYGGAGNLQRTVREFERAGVAGIFIEDQVHPVFCGSLKKFKKIVSKETMVSKIKCALDARKDPDFIIAARTDADIVSMEEQIDRCNAYAEAGADMVTPLPQTREEFERVAKEIKAPLWVYLSPMVGITPKEMEDMGVRGLVAYPVELLFAATKAMMDMVTELRTKGTVHETADRIKALDYRSFFNFIGLRQSLDVDNKFPFTLSK
ncbi:MAG: isocitrate lyase/PEP mutase family protein [Proteobacteria bacterium]|nr:isocitrate lyase/PEP mutase family protein [Pseudomonadota bacterium]MBU4470150.1 isocitrate lyase/PEP mutase family protein [Pseudomonadota bacterium]MCG2753133.1 isocitrate lyase/PEP mutase family protein [Desulfobacteraceae bacterium]